METIVKLTVLMPDSKSSIVIGILKWFLLSVTAEKLLHAISKIPAFLLIRLMVSADDQLTSSSRVLFVTAPLMSSLGNMLRLQIDSVP